MTSLIASENCARVVTARRRNVNDERSGVFQDEPANGRKDNSQTSEDAKSFQDEAVYFIRSIKRDDAEDD